MKTIPLTKGAVAIVDDADYPALSARKWYLANTGYAAHKLARGAPTLLMHREVMGTPRGMHTDHINRNKLDNRRENLRVCAAAQNQGNRGKAKGRFASDYKGVTRARDCDRWIAAMYIGPRSGQVYLGIFKSEVDAARAYDRAAIARFGEFARLNFPEQRAGIENAVADDVLTDSAA